MATGLTTFDDFGWASLLAGRAILVIDRDPRRSRARGEALEEAGASVTLAPGQPIGLDRLRNARFRHMILELGGGEAIQPALAPHLGSAAVVLADPARHGALRASFPEARIGDHTLDARDLVLFMTGTADE